MLLLEFLESFQQKMDFLVVVEEMLILEIREKLLSLYLKKPSKLRTELSESSLECLLSFSP